MTMKVIGSGVGVALAAWLTAAVGAVPCPITPGSIDAGGGKIVVQVGDSAYQHMAGLLNTGTFPPTVDITVRLSAIGALSGTYTRVLRVSDYDAWIGQTCAEGTTAAGYSAAGVVNSIGDIVIEVDDPTLLDYDPANQDADFHELGELIIIVAPPTSLCDPFRDLENTRAVTTRYEPGVVNMGIVRFVPATTGALCGTAQQRADAADELRRRTRLIASVSGDIGVAPAGGQPRQSIEVGQVFSLRAAGRPSSGGTLGGTVHPHVRGLGFRATPYGSVALT